MAQKRKAKKKVSATLAEYRKARASLLRKISRYKQAGYETDGADFTAPPIPQRVTKKSIRLLREQSERLTRMRRMGKLTPPMAEPELPEAPEIPEYDDMLVKIFEGVIYAGLHYLSPRRAEVMRVRHRASYAGAAENMLEIAHDLAIRAVANQNLARTWPRLVERLERYIFASDQYGYEGDLLELEWIFRELIDSGQKDSPPEVPEERAREAFDEIPIGISWEAWEQMAGEEWEEGDFYG